jgi:hypothetical protein
MRCRALSLVLLLCASTAHATCPADVPAAEGSSARSLSDVPYQGQPASPCPATEPAPQVPRVADWASPVGDSRETVNRIGLFAIGFGSLLLLTGAQFALCARQSIDAPSRDFCRAVRTPTLLAGGTVAALGLGTITYGWLMSDTRPAGRAGISAGLGFRIATR